MDTRCRQRATRRLSITALLLVPTFTGCDTKPQPDPFVGVLAMYKDCRERYAEIDARVDQAGVRDTSYYRVPGFPYFRSDRVLASFREEVSTTDELGGWMRRMREFDQEARDFEYLNLGLNDQERGEWRDRLANCGFGLAGIELKDRAKQEQLYLAVQPPDEYSSFARILGAYPLAVPLLKSRIADEQAAIREEFSAPLAPADPSHSLILTAAISGDAAKVLRSLDKAMPDELGFPGLVSSEWLALVEHNAPALLIEPPGEGDQPGMPRWTDAGVSVDPSQPSISYRITFTRFGGERLVQLNYFIWFKGRGPSLHDASQADLDGLIWRVTLDRHARPLVYESINASGRRHEWFPVQALKLREDRGYWSEPPLLPQGQVAIDHPMLRLQTGTHRLVRVIAMPDFDANAQPRSYDLYPYEDLLALQKPDGSTRSLFGPDGQIANSDVGDVAWLWSSGVSEPGALRVLGRQATSYVGRSHFDDPFVLESVFVPPSQAALPPATTATH